MDITLSAHHNRAVFRNNQFLRIIFTIAQIEGYLIGLAPDCSKLHVLGNACLYID